MYALNKDHEGLSHGATWPTKDFLAFVSVFRGRTAGPTCKFSTYRHSPGVMSRTETLILYSRLFLHIEPICDSLRTFATVLHRNGQEHYLLFVITTRVVILRHFSLRGAILYVVPDFVRFVLRLEGPGQSVARKKMMMFVRTFLGGALLLPTHSLL